jgi:hypothetical protein
MNSWHWLLAVARNTSACATLLILLGLVASSGVTSSASAAGPYGPGYKYCGSFKAGYHIRVYATHLSCRKAVDIQKEYWLGPRHRKVVVNGGSGAFGYVLLKRYPGWRCGSGAGGGQCTKGKASAAYQD